MPLHPPVRAAHKTSTAGTGPVQLLAPSSEFRSFKEVFGASSVKVAYVIAGQGIYETGFGLFNGEDQISRDTVLNGSNGTNPVNLPAGQKDCFAWWAGGGFERYAAATDSVRPDDWMGMVSLSSSTSFTLPSINTVPYGFECTIRCVQAAATVGTTSGQTIDGATSVNLKSGDTLVLMRDRTQWRVKSIAYGAAMITDIARGAGHVLGEIKVLSANVPMPARFLPCDGRNISRSTYSALFAVLGTVYGMGDGSTTFGIPDARGRALAGADVIFGGPSAGRLFGVGPSWGGGQTTHTLTVDNMPSHTHVGVTDQQGAHAHNTTLPSGSGVAGGSVSSFSGPGSQAVNTSINGTHSHNIQTSATGGNVAFQLIQPTMTFNVVIYAGA